MSGLAGLSTSLVMLVIVRFFVGVGSGGGSSPLLRRWSLNSHQPTSGAGWSFCSRVSGPGAGYWPPDRLSSYTGVWVASGFFPGSLTGAYAAYLRKDLPESPRYLELVGREREAEEIVSQMERAAGIEPSKEAATLSAAKIASMGLAQLFSSAFLRRTVCLWIMWFGLNFGYYGFVIWIPTLMVGKGFVLIKSLQYTLIMTLRSCPATSVRPTLLKS